jgi:competence protein ComEC
MPRACWKVARCGFLMVAALLAQQGRSLAQSIPPPSLQIYIIDTEGGNAVLFVGPTGESVLIDTGNPGTRDADRIVAAATDAGVKQIDHLIITHWHEDHFGGLEELSKRMPIREFIDHGLNEQVAPDNSSDCRASIGCSRLAEDFSRMTYVTLYGKGVHTVVKPGDIVRVPGLDWRIVSANGVALTTPLPGAGKANPACAGVTKMQPEGQFGISDDPKDSATENGRSIGSVVTFGAFRIAMLGDLTFNKELELMCPNNPIGTVDVLISSHHGLQLSNSPALVHALRPRVYIMNNGPRKGGQADPMKTVFSSPGLEDVWQIHVADFAGQEYTAPGLFIANPADLPIPPAPAGRGQAAQPSLTSQDHAYWIKVSAQRNGTFAVLNPRNTFSKTYAK